LLPEVLGVLLLRKNAARVQSIPRHLAETSLCPFNWRKERMPYLDNGQERNTVVQKR
jgi:hypothetical protein